MTAAVVAGALRSPMGKGKPGGALSSLHAVELLSQVLQALISQTGIDPGIVDDVIVGCVTQAGEQAATPGRMAWLGAGYPAHVPSTTIDRRCGSSQQAISFAAQGIKAGAYEVVIAAGIESMSRVPMGSARMGQDPLGPSVHHRYSPGLVSQGIAAELVAARWALDRDELDEYSVRSHCRAASAVMAGEFAKETVPIKVPDREQSIAADETVRPGTSAEALAKLPPAFHSAEMAHRFPELGWNVTAGNSSQITDGASAVLLVSEARAARLGLSARARIHASYVCGDDPMMMLTGPIPATRVLLERSRLRLSEIDHVEVNEAFAAVPLAWLAEFPLDEDKLNPAGGAIALGHPLGASGARLFTTMLHALERTRGRWGLQTMCEAGGMANAMIIERL